MKPHRGQWRPGENCRDIGWIAYIEVPDQQLIGQCRTRPGCTNDEEEGPIWGGRFSVQAPLEGHQQNVERGSDNPDQGQSQGVSGRLVIGLDKTTEQTDRIVQIRGHKPSHCFADFASYHSDTLSYLGLATSERYSFS